MYIIEHELVLYVLYMDLNVHVCFENQSDNLACKKMAGQALLISPSQYFFLVVYFALVSRTWCDGNATGPLARASFDLHKKYGAMFDCDYRALDTLEVCFFFVWKALEKSKT